jgi:uncharacterized protein YxjI
VTAQFCVGCGNPLPAGAQFCGTCGRAVVATPLSESINPPGPAPLADATAAYPPPPPPPSTFSSTTPGRSGLSLSELLGLQGQRNFLVQHQIVSLGHNYRVMDASKRHLFTVRGDVGQNLSANALGSLLGGSDSYLGRMAARSVNMTYTLVSTQGAALGSILKEGGANRSQFTLVDSAGQRLVLVTLERGLMGGITATAVSADGRTMFQTGGNLVRHNFIIKDGGGKDLAKVHEAWVAVRDTYNVDMIENVDPLYPLVFTILIDFEKVK